MRYSTGICVAVAAGIATARCAMHDCAPPEARIKEGHWEVLIFPYNADYARWFPVPDHAVLRRENPDGRPVVCRTPNGFIRCFVPPPGS